MSKRKAFIERNKHLPYQMYSVAVNSYDQGIREGVEQALGQWDIDPEDPTHHTRGCDMYDWEWFITGQPCNCYLSKIKAQM